PYSPAKPFLLREGRPLHVAVCMKMTPDATDLTIDPVKKTLDRTKVKNIINPPDENAFELALQLKDRFGAQVSVVTMGPPFFDIMLRECVSRGADRGVLITDRAFAGADTWPTSMTLGAGIKKISRQWGDVDIILFGEETTDASTGQVGPGVAGQLATEQATYIHSLEFDPATETVTATRSIGGGHEVLRMPLPAAVTCELKINTPRLASLNGKLRGANAQLVVWALSDLTDIKDPSWVGLKGSPTIVGKVDISSGFERHAKKVPAAADAVQELVTRGVVS
ncbi:MAG TPA: electron transfer flavoprotein subunit beta/FixA family protein, partial [Candidatus Thermoplasmatota archaeon]|nr:electron transfer flavoprotein subunit beta/FixA family protein [Candidatus Thermoplasmatota archaeon]